MSEEALVGHIFVRIQSQVQDYGEVRHPQNLAQLLEMLCKFEERYSCKPMQSSKIRDNVGMSAGCLMLLIVGEIGGIRKFCADRVTAKRIIREVTRMVVMEISGSLAGLDFRGMIEVLTIEDTNLEMGAKMTILVEANAEIEVRVRILVKAIEGNEVDEMF
ncbi:uncharacterized protein TNCV_5084051 [Trichonephila clavipes]|nr:uncharacterized protein TNCV_5084051 [Trichonephila clavipes]